MGCVAWLFFIISSVSTFHGIVILFVHSKACGTFASQSADFSDSYPSTLEPYCVQPYSKICYKNTEAPHSIRWGSLLCKVNKRCDYCKYCARWKKTFYCLGKTPDYKRVLCENACGSPDVCILVIAVTLGRYFTVLSHRHHTTLWAFVETCDGVKCSPGKVCTVMMGRPQCVCSPDCSNITKKHAVCGSDGKTYKDECALLLARCMGHPDLEIMYQGECKSKTGIWFTKSDVYSSRCSYVLYLVFSHRILFQRGVSGNPQLCDRPDQQRSLRHVPYHALPAAHALRAANLWQRQHHVPQRLPPAPGHLLPRPLHRSAPLRPLQQ